MRIITDDIKKYDKEWWENYYKNYIHEQSDSDKIHFKKAAEIVKGKVLDFGCGEGWFCGYLENQKDYTGIDWTSTNLERARKRFPKAKFIQGNLDIFNDNEFEFATAFEVFEHLEDPKNIIKQLKRIARNVIITIPNGILGEKVVENDKKALSAFTKEYKYHYATYEKEDIIEMFPSAEFIDVDKEHLFFVIKNHPKA